jgi:hypothetical protein
MACESALFVSPLRALLLTAALLLLLPSAGSAQTRNDASYEEVTSQALRAFEAGRAQEARTLFERAHALRPSARTWRVLALTALALDRYTTARVELANALNNAVDPLTAQQRDELTGWQAWMAENLATVQLHPSPATSAIEVDKEPVAAGVTELWLTEGAHTLRAEAPGFQPFSETLRVSPGERRELTVRLLPLPAATVASAQEVAARTAPPIIPRPRAADAPEGSVLRTVAYVAGALGVGALAAGVALGVAAGGKNAEIDKLCPNLDACARDARAPVEELQREARPLVVAANVSYVVGAAALGTGVVLWFVSQPNEQRSAELSVHATPVAVGLRLQGRY